MTREQLINIQEGAVNGFVVGHNGDNFTVKNEQEGFSFDTIEEVADFLEL